MQPVSGGSDGNRTRSETLRALWVTCRLYNTLPSFRHCSVFYMRACNRHWPHYCLTHAAVPAPPALSSRHHRLSDCFHVDVPLQLFAFCATSLPPLDLWLALPFACAFPCNFCLWTGPESNRQPRLQHYSLFSIIRMC